MGNDIKFQKHCKATQTKSTKLNFRLVTFASITLFQNLWKQYCTMPWDVKFQNPRTTPSGRKVKTQGERELVRKIMPKIVATSFFLQCGITNKNCSNKKDMHDWSAYPLCNILYCISLIYPPSHTILHNPSTPLSIDIEGIFLSKQSI